MEIPKILGLLGGIFSAIAYLPYWYSILKGTTIPHRTGWFVWLISDIMILISSIKLQATYSLWLIWAYVIGTAITFLLSIKRGIGGTSKTDFIIVGLTIISGVLWWATGKPVVALCINLGIVVMGCIPTFNKVRINPFSENMISFFNWLLGSLLTLVSVALTTWKFEIIISPIVFLSMQALITSTMLINRSAKSRITE